MVHHILKGLLTLNVVVCSFASVIDIRAHGAVAGRKTAAENNTAAFNRALNAAQPNDVVLVPMDPAGPFIVIGGITMTNKSKVTVQLDGSLQADANFAAWPLMDLHGNSVASSSSAESANDGQYMHIIHLIGCNGLTVKGNGMIDGQGAAWWARYTIGICGIDPEKPANFTGCPHRPKALVIDGGQEILVENITTKNSPSFNIQLNHVDGAEVRFVTIKTELDVIRNFKAEKRRRRLAVRGGATVNEGALQPEDLNTDGIDPSGRDVWIHHVLIENDDDSIAVKPSNLDDPISCTENILVEDAVMTGFGASIGSVPPSTAHNCVRNVTFRRISMPETGKGVYVKSNPLCEPGSTGEITNIVYEDMNISKPRWWPIWIGPQQQQEPGKALGNDCALDFPINPHCPTQGCVTFTNITLRRITVIEPWLSPGVILGNATNPMRGIVFDQVVVTMTNDSGNFPYDRKYLTQNAFGSAIGGTTPNPNLQ